MNSMAGLTLSATQAIAAAWIATAIWKTFRVPKRGADLCPSRMKAAIEKVPAVIAVPTRGCRSVQVGGDALHRDGQRVHRERCLDLGEHHNYQRQPRGRLGSSGYQCCREMLDISCSLVGFNR